MQKIVIRIKNRSWKDIEESVAALSVLDPTIAIAADIVKYVTLTDLPPELKSLIAEYGAACAPFSKEQSLILQFRAYALYATGRIRDAMNCIKSIGRCAEKKTYETSWWCNKLGVEQYYSGHYENACVVLRYALTFEDGSLHGGLNTALLLLLEGDFAGALSFANQMSGNEDKSWESWPSLIRGSSFAGLHMYDRSIEALDACIVGCKRSDLMAQAIALRSAVLERQHPTTDQKKEESKNWIYDLHKKTAAAHAAAHGVVNMSYVFVLPTEFVCSITPVPRAVVSSVPIAQQMPSVISDSDSETLSTLCCVVS